MVVSTVIVLGACTNHHVSDVELYGNTFIHLNDSDFTAPSDWVEYSLMDSSFTISIPPYTINNRRYENVGKERGCV